MEKVEETLTLGVSIILSEICEQLLTKAVKNEDGTLTTVDRNLPFRLRYRLTRNKTALDKDVAFFHKQRMLYLAQYGELTADGENVAITDPQKSEAYKGQIQALFDTEVKHNIIKLEEEDIDQIRDIDINLTSDALGIFIGYMTNDTALLEDLGREITITPTFKEYRVNNTAQITPALETKDVEKAVEESTIITPSKKRTTKKKVTQPAEVVEKTESVVEKPKKTKTQKKIENISEGKPVFDDVPTGETVAKPKKTTKKKTKE